MKQALIDGKLTLSTPDASATATCPRCGGIVKLRNRQGSYFWRHVQLPRGGCSPVPIAEPGTADVGDIEASGDHKRWTRQIGGFVIELHLDKSDTREHHLKLRSLSAEETDGPSGMIFYLSEVRPLALALLDAVADLAGLAAGDKKKM